MLRRRFVVSQQVVEVGSEFRGFDPPKTQAGRRSVPIWAPIYPILEDQLAERAQHGKDGLVFVNTRATRRTYRASPPKRGRKPASASDARTSAGTI